ncbi:MAG: multidrug ABC transporter ATP-binding protein, partial [Verrucomicrobia bacterium]|nr:multidrug ABC transporter ATP-binding protein [Verrucomicrobiota bacterium]
LHERPEIAEAELEEEGDRIRVMLTEGQANGGVIAEIIVNGGLQLTGLEEDEMDLEDVFLQVTRGETQ